MTTAQEVHDAAQAIAWMDGKAIERAFAMLIEYAELLEQAQPVKTSASRAAPSQPEPKQAQPGESGCSA